MSWENEEIEAYAFLKSLGLNNIVFEACGKHNSNIPDIKVLKNGSFIFYIEVKMNMAQSSQFVIEKHESKFKFSELNKTENNEFKKEILNYLNNHFNTYKNVSSKGIEVKCDKVFSYGHINSDLEFKCIKYIITRAREKTSKFKIIHRDNFKNFFDIKCILRRKKSGSSPISKKNLDKVRNYVTENFNASIKNHEDTKNFLFQSEKSDLLGHYFNIDNEQYFISKKKYNNYFRVNRTSKTNNPNIIFDIQLINHIIDDDMKLLKNDLSA